MTRLAFVAISTTGPAVPVHDVWEIALIKRHDDGSDHEHHWYIRPRLAIADSDFLADGRFYERTSDFPEGDAPSAVKVAAGPLRWSSAREIARRVATETAGVPLAGWDVAFTVAMLERFLRDNHQAPAWQPRPAEVATLRDGYNIACPSSTLAVAQNEPASGDALEQARWSRDLYDAIASRPRQQSVSA